MNRQQQAINDYLQALLNDVEDEALPELPVAEAEPETRTPTLGLDQLVAEIPEVVTETETELKTEVEVEVEVEAPAVEVVTEAEPALAEPEVTPDVVTASAGEVSGGIPDWAEGKFQCLLFKVSGLTLAVPLVKLNSVMPWPEKINETPNRTDWYLGLVSSHGQNVKVIDTALMVLPENRRQSLVGDAAERFSHILLVDDYNWGLACDAIGDVIWLSADDVKWRQNKQQRPWLAGTAIKQMCALMDTEVFADMLNRQVAGEGA